MKQTLIMFLLLAGLQAHAKPKKPIDQKIVEGPTATATFLLYERDQAEPVSQPREIQVNVDCKKGYKQKNTFVKVTVCSADFKAKTGLEVTDKALVFFHYGWDPQKSSNNMQGEIVCDTKNRVVDTFKMSDFCTKR